jgi:hypothetical protein
MFAFQVITSRDVQSVLIAGVVLVLFAGLGIYFRQRIKTLLTEREWRILFRLIAIVIMALILVFTNIAAEFPAEKFIYGRF